MEISSRSLSNWNKTNDSLNQITITDRIQKFLDRKFRISQSYRTVHTYKNNIKRFELFSNQFYNMNLGLLIDRIQDKQIDPLDVLDDFYTHLTKVRPVKSRKPGYAARTIKSSVITAKEFLNDIGCRIYWEDLKRKFRLPKEPITYQEGLTKTQISQLVRLANYKTATAILIACSSGMRLGEIAQLKLGDIDLEKIPAEVRIRAETTKTNEGRITHISSQATRALKDFVAKCPRQKEDYIFLMNYYMQPKKRYLKSREPAKMSPEELHDYKVQTTEGNLSQQLWKIIKEIPELNKKNENGTNMVHFHAFRYFFKTQVTDAHQSDFAEALMGHKSLKLVYYRQNAAARARTYLDVEHALTISDTETIDENYSEMQKDNLELRGIVDSLSKQLRNLEKRIEIKS